MIRNDIERRRYEEEVEGLRRELEGTPADQRDEIARNVENGLRMRISDLEERIAEYDRLKEGQVPVFEGESLDDLGEVIIKARISRGWSQADLARALGMEPQQVQRYERNDWQKISLWRLQEVAEVLDLSVNIRGRLNGHEVNYVRIADAPQPKWYRHHAREAQGLGLSGFQVAARSWDLIGDDRNLGHEEAAGHHLVRLAHAGGVTGAMNTASLRQGFQTDERGGIGYARLGGVSKAFGSRLMPSQGLVSQGSHG